MNPLRGATSPVYLIRCSVEKSCLFILITYPTDSHIVLNICRHSPSLNVCLSRSLDRLTPWWSTKGISWQMGTTSTFSSRSTRKWHWQLRLSARRQITQSHPTGNILVPVIAFYFRVATKRFPPLKGLPPRPNTPFGVIMPDQVSRRLLLARIEWGQGESLNPW